MDEKDPDGLIARAAAGEAAALAELFGRHRERLRKMVRLRLDRRLQGRVDPSDVLQEAYLDLAEKLPEYARERAELPFHLWLRLVTGERLLRIHRQHLGAAMRDAGREVSIDGGAVPEGSGPALADQLTGRFTTASQAAIRAEVRARLEEAIEGMDPMDREVIALRHFEELSNSDAARVLGISRQAASNRHVRALARLHGILAQVPGLIDGDPGRPG